MYRSNLNPTILEKYLKFCLAHGLIEEEGAGYRATRKGAELVHHLEEISSLKRSIEEITKQAQRLIDTRSELKQLRKHNPPPFEPGPM
jgi:predicted transcriptional regulator